MSQDPDRPANLLEWLEAQWRADPDRLPPGCVAGHKRDIPSLKRCAARGFWEFLEGVSAGVVLVRLTVEPLLRSQEPLGLEFMGRTVCYDEHVQLLRDMTDAEGKMKVWEGMMSRSLRHGTRASQRDKNAVYELLRRLDFQCCYFGLRVGFSVGPPRDKSEANVAIRECARRTLQARMEWKQMSVKERRSVANA
jgi:hypothetical protein